MPSFAPPLSRMPGLLSVPMRFEGAHFSAWVTVVAAVVVGTVSVAHVTVLVNVDVLDVTLSVVGTGDVEA